MLGTLIAARNIIIAVLLSWIGMGFATPDNNQDDSQDPPETSSLLGQR
jgi:hypothetical protein